MQQYAGLKSRTTGSCHKLSVSTIALLLAIPYAPAGPEFHPVWRSYGLEGAGNGVKYAATATPLRLMSPFVGV